MPSPDRAELIAAKNLLAKRRGNTADANEQSVIDDAIAELNDAIEDLDNASLLQAAGLVARAADALERVIASARMGPFDSFLSDIQATLGRLQSRIDAMQASERLPPAPLSEQAEPVPATALGPAAGTGQPVDAPGGSSVAGGGPATVAAEASAQAIPTPVNSRNFSALRDEYASLFDVCRLRPEFAANVEFYVSRLIKHKPTYELVGSNMGIPWVFIGIVHGMECGFNFTTHLHNGDPLSGPTTHVPKGRPEPVQRSFSWLESARDALEFKKLDEVTDWSLPHLLYLLEAYNGFGYRPRGIPTPYLWSFSSLYRSGKFVADGVFDPNAISKQCGAAVMLRTLQERGVA